MQAAAASTLVAGSVMLAICMARGTLELLFWGCRLARHQTPPQPPPDVMASPLHGTLPRN